MKPGDFGYTVSAVLPLHDYAWVSEQAAKERTTKAAIVRRAVEKLRDAESRPLVGDNK